MKKLFLTTFMLTLASGYTGAITQPAETTATMVYICTGKSSKRYHKTDECRGLDNCSGDIKLITIEKAKQMGRTPCRVCYKEQHFI